MIRFFLCLLLAGWSTLAFGQNNPATHRYLPPADANLDPNWDWTLPANTIPNGYTVFFNAAATTQSTNVQLPFNSSGHPLADAISHSAKDMYPEDGWMLVYRDFGTAGAAIQPKLPFFVLYNKYRGKLRVMVYNGTGASYTSYRMSLSFRSSSPKAGLLTFTSASQTTLENYNKLNPNDNQQIDRFFGATTPNQGWFYGDFTLFGYDPNLSPDAIMHIEITNVNRTDLTLKSTKFTLDEVLQNDSPGGTGVATGAKFFHGVEDIRKAASETTTLGTIAKSTTLSIVPYIGSLMDIIGLFIGGQDAASPREPIQFSGVLEMSGDATTNFPFWAEDFALNQNKTNTPEVYRPVQPIPWGVFNLDGRPSYHVVQDRSGCEYDSYYGTNFCWDDYTVGIDNPVTYKFNPSPLLGMTLTKVEMRTNTMSDFVPVSDFDGYVFSYYYDPRGIYNYTIPQAVYLKLTFHITNPVRNSDPNIVVFKNLGACYSQYGQVSDCSASGQRLAKSTTPVKPSLRNTDLTIAPNPAAEKTSFTFVNTTAGPVQVSILNMLGQQVWHKSSVMEAGTIHYIWDNRNTPAKLAPGTYLINVQTTDWHQAKRLVIE
ncbi:T9SS type A sorting domain-containing protein [Hymenobacter cheonanensis]|uniref:T9SS type A sorting domain-containing protein n=1 Tax=Hymenobacter sp. CA2-7 TaxID=3063993 RepID=UPI00271392C2|nr:T9SS type A sorting domain-containing protein [Hymenobacter sp. CA2-7]MDO7887664.1 T9SS type A sorting domain-containing protein [Hymenobacter sp. CA2-7]